MSPFLPCTKTLRLAQRSYANRATISSCTRVSPEMGQGRLGSARREARSQQGRSSSLHSRASEEVANVRPGQHPDVHHPGQEGEADPTDCPPKLIDTDVEQCQRPRLRVSHPVQLDPSRREHDQGSCDEETKAD